EEDSTKSETPKETKDAPKEQKTQSISTPTTSDGDRVFASPLAKKMAEEKGINLSHVQGSGDNGRIVKKDIENFQPGATATQAYTPVGEERFEELKNSQMRKTIAKRLSQSKFTAPHYYLTV